MSQTDPGLNRIRLSINLLPPEYRHARADLTWLMDRKVIYPVMGLLIVCFALFWGWLYTQDRLASLETDKARITDEIQKERPLLDTIKQLDDQLKVIAAKVQALKSIQVSKKRWVIVFENISSVLPANTWLQSVQQVSPQMLEIKGLTYDFNEVAEYMLKLEEQVSILDVTLVSITTAKVESEDGFAFTMKAAINPDLGLESPR